MCVYIYIYIVNLFIDLLIYLFICSHPSSSSRRVTEIHFDEPVGDPTLVPKIKPNKLMRLSSARNAA